MIKMYQEIYKKPTSERPGIQLRITTLNGAPQVTVFSEGEWRKGYNIRSLSGKLQTISAEEEESLMGSNDFSVIISTKKKETSLLFGPIRLVNHHCTRSNASVCSIT